MVKEKQLIFHLVILLLLTIFIDVGKRDAEMKEVRPTKFVGRTFFCGNSINASCFFYFCAVGLVAFAAD